MVDPGTDAGMHSQVQERPRWSAREGAEGTGFHLSALSEEETDPSGMASSTCTSSSPSTLLSLVLSCCCIFFYRSRSPVARVSVSLLPVISFNLAMVFIYYIAQDRQEMKITSWPHECSILKDEIVAYLNLTLTIFIISIVSTAVNCTRLYVIQEKVLRHGTR